MHTPGSLALPSWLSIKGTSLLVTSSLASQPLSSAAWSWHNLVLLWELPSHTMGIRRPPKEGSTCCVCICDDVYGLTCVTLRNSLEIALGSLFSPSLDLSLGLPCMWGQGPESICHKKAVSTPSAAQPLPSATLTTLFYISLPQDVLYALFLSLNCYPPPNSLSENIPSAPTYRHKPKQTGSR